MMRLRKPVVRELPYQSLLGVLDIFLMHESDPVRYPEHVRVDRDLLLAKALREHDICRLPADPRERLKSLPAVRDFPIKIFGDDRGKLHYILRLLMIHADTLYVPLHIRRISASQFSRARIRSKKIRRHLVNTHISRLSRKHRGNKKLPHIPVFQRTLRIRIFNCQPVKNLDRRRLCQRPLCHINSYDSSCITASSTDVGQYSVSYLVPITQIFSPSPRSDRISVNPALRMSSSISSTV